MTDDKPPRWHPATTPRVARYRRNHVGRDFIVGDVHGTFDQVLEAMRASGFDRERDRLFCAGDLIDRHEDSYRVTRFLRNPWIKSVKGNHEEALLEAYADGEAHPLVLDYLVRAHKIQWWLALADDARQAVLAELRKLPYVIEIETARGLVGIVHADVPRDMPWSEFTRHIEQGTEKVLETALVGRDRVLGNCRTEGVMGIDRVFVGHTPVEGGPKQFGNVFAIDTGGVFNVLAGKPQHGLTFTNILSKTTALADEVRPGMDPVLVIDEAASQPFGQYATPRAR